MRSQADNYRAISWWLKWEDTNWPDQDVADRILRRADAAADAGVNLAIIFGTHFRWDFLPLWSRLHDLFAFTADALHQRRIKLFDHHSAVLTHRPRTADDARRLDDHMRHHVLSYPSLEAAAEMCFEGQRLNDWRMINIETGEPTYNERWCCEQFCMNNPDFRRAYQAYVRRLIDETGIDGLMSDDAIYNMRWQACGCRWCRDRFRRDYGHELPPTTDMGFWGNRDSEAFKDWIEMRFCSAADFLGCVREATGPDFPLSSCCSGSVSQRRIGTAMTAQEFIKSCNVIMLEMCWRVPEADGTWNRRVSQLGLHLSITRDAGAKCIGLGYGFFKDTAFFVWAVNKFLGSDCWFSTIKDHLGLPDSQLQELPDEPELIKEAYCWERDHASLFGGEPVANTAVFFSRSTRDFYGQASEKDYTDDYSITCHELIRGGIDFEVVTSMPEPGRRPVLVLSSVICLSQKEREQLDAFLAEGGIIIATGPVGLRDERARPSAAPWLGGYDIDATMAEPERAPGFPPFTQAEPAAPPKCTGRYRGQLVAADEWVRVVTGKGVLLWSPGRVQTDAAALALPERVAQRLSPQDVRIERRPDGWFLCRFRQGDRLLIHGIPGQVKPALHPTLKIQGSNVRIVERIDFDEPSPPELLVRLAADCASAVLHSPDLAAPRACTEYSDGVLSVDLGGVRRYFVLELSN